MDKQSKVDATYLVGLMSGTSVDGIDAAVVKLFPSAEKEHGVEIELLAFENTPLRCKLETPYLSFLIPLALRLIRLAQ